MPHTIVTMLKQSAKNIIVLIEIMYLMYLLLLESAEFVTYFNKKVHVSLLQVEVQRSYVMCVDSNSSMDVLLL